MTASLLTRALMLRGMVQSLVRAEPRSTVLYPPAWTRTPAGEPPELIENEGTIVYGDNVVAMFPEVRTECHHPARYPADCIYDATKTGIEYRRCIWCKRLTG